jgi:hypothetical protein
MRACSRHISFRPHEPTQAPLPKGRKKFEDILYETDAVKTLTLNPKLLELQTSILNPAP